MRNVDKLFEGLHRLDIEELLNLADSQQVLLHAETEDLVYLVQELAARLHEIVAPHPANEHNG